MNVIRKKHLSRRALIRGGGVALSLPLLEAMIPAATAWAKSGAKPKPWPRGSWPPAAAGTVRPRPPGSGRGGTDASSG